MLTEAQRNCPHDQFEAYVEVNRLIDVGQWRADVTVTCAKCRAPFSFVGPKYGLLEHEVTVGIGRTELRARIEPGETPLEMPAAGIRFEVAQRPKES